MPSKLHVRTLWLSDLHLGSRACHVDTLLQFLSQVRCEQLYLTGDVIDFVLLRRSRYWPAAHTEVLRRFLLMSQQGTRVIYIPGNHDDELRRLAGLRLGNVSIAKRAVHVTRDGERLLVLHGDEFDGVLNTGPLLKTVGACAYGLLLATNRLVHRGRALLGLPYWSLAQHVKTRIGRSSHYIERFRSACLAAAREARVDGVVCGHIHLAEIVDRAGLRYCNDGDWVESCTALVEDRSGELTLLRWHEVLAQAAEPQPQFRDAA
jgi:UDP-2,3-diacylglucosamine pyrophosphatase LpxH